MHDDGRDRRDFLRVLGGAAVVVSAAPLTGCPWHHSPAHGALEAGNVGAIPEGTLAPVDDQPVLLGHDARGLYAMSTVCAHKGCDIRSHGEITNQGLHCSCHGSRYDANGLPTHGPADHPLDHYAVTIADDGRVVIDAEKLVSPDARTPLPQR
jgi:Rieske Fe-S protein